MSLKYVLKNSENNLSGREKKSGAEDSAHELGALAAFPENLSSIPRTHMAADNCKSSPRGLNTLTQTYIYEGKTPKNIN